MRYCKRGHAWDRDKNNTCRTCALETAREKYRRNREFIYTLKRERGCADCGFNKWPESMDFDHVRGEKRFGISKWMTANIETLLAEIEKCDVVCANCHRHRTFERLQVLEEVG